VRHALRSDTVGSQGELRCGAIHKFKCSCKCWRSEDRRYDVNGKAPAGKIVADGLKAVPRKQGWLLVLPFDAVQQGVLPRVDLPSSSKFSV
jgi:hypothetical protein